MIRRVPILLLLSVLCTPGARAMDGYELFESTAASVNREVLFLSDVQFEQCLHRCAAMPESRVEDLSLEEARNRLIADTLALQEQRKLELGQVDNAALAAAVREAAARLEKCDSPCREGIAPKRVSEWVERKLLVREFLRRRVAVFVEVKDEDVRREYQRRAGREDAAPGLSEEKVRQDLLEAKVAQEIRNWYDRAASKSRIILSPLEGR